MSHSIKSKAFSKIIISFILGLGISFYWWFPAFTEKHFLQTQTPFYYKDHFPFIKQLIVPFWGYGASNPGIGDDISLQIGLVNLTLILVALPWIMKRKQREGYMPLLFFLGILAAVILMNIRSSFIWEAFSLAGYIQFPWRLLMVTTFLTSSLVIFVDKLTNSKIILSVLGLAAVLFTHNYFRPSEYFRPTDNYFLNRFFADRTVSGKSEYPSSDYQNYSEDYLLLPRWVKSRPASLPQEKITSETARVSSVSELTPTNYEAIVDSPSQAQISVNFYYFPGWEIYVDGIKNNPEILYPLGNMAVKIPSGIHKIQVVWQETTSRKLADLVSLVSVVTVIYLLFKNSLHE